MRINLPVTGVEYQIDDDTLILSTTDTKGRITYVNQTFIDVSGFTEKELIGKAHNIVRHPDMPPEAFKDLWDTLSAGLPWTGLVKNRRKNGDFYWITANTTPLLKSGKITGYLSVRTKASHEMIEKVAPIYRQVLNGTARNLKIKKGQVVRTDLISKVASSFHMTICKRISLFMGIAVSSLFVVGGAGWWGMTQSPALPWLSSFIAGTAIAGIALTSLMGCLIFSNFRQSIRRATDIATTIAAGDLTAKIETDRMDEFGELLKSLSQMNTNLRATVLDVRNNAHTVNQATGEIASGNASLAERTESQASSLEKAAASMEELTATVRQNSENSQQANQLALAASNITTKGGGMMKEVIATMSTINESSKQISEIINVIDGIAFQTNILALNAAVEAARAGEQGRGFAVVATEVQSLAQRSAEAAKEIKILINNSVTKVNQGAELVNNTGKTMKEIINSINHLTNIMTEITVASQEQSNGIEQVNQAVTQIDEVTQQDAALAEEAAASAELLKQQGAGLINAISIFNVTNATKQNTGVSQLPTIKSTKQLNKASNARKVA